MKSLTSKRTDRLEKKKKKMAALLEISKLNEYDRVTKSAQNKCTSSESLEIEPKPKKSRTDCDKSPTLKSTDHNIGPSGKPKLYGEEYKKLKKLLREHSNKMKVIPRFHLREMGDNASLKKDLDSRVPLFLSDIQHLIMYSQIGPHSPYSPARWCALEKFNKLQCTAVLVIEDISMYHYVSHSSSLSSLSKFEFQVEIVTPRAYKATSVQDLATVPLTRTLTKKYREEHGSLEKAVQNTDEIFDKIRHLFPLNEPSANNSTDLPDSDKFPRTQLLLSGWQMVEENFPLPIKGLMDTKYKGYVLTKDNYEEVKSTSPMFAVDCEMCLTTAGLNELTRISIVDENLKVVYEQLVKPDNKIIDYLTRFSGITAKMMKNVKKSLESVQEDLRGLLPPDAILVGQSLNSDMHALKMMHPYVIDTSVIYNVTGDRQRKTKLKMLSREFLKESIQEGSRGHCSIEDSLACMKLVKHKLTKNLYYGDAVLGGIKSQFRHHIGEVADNTNYVSSMLKLVTKLDKSARVVANEETTAKYKLCTFKNAENCDGHKRVSCVSEESNEDVLKTFCEGLDDWTLNIAHLNGGEVSRGEGLEVVDSWVGRVFEKMGVPGLCIVVFAGDNNASNGCCFIQVKKQQS